MARLGSAPMRIQMVREASEIPTWADEGAKAELREVFEDDDETRSALVIAFDGAETDVYWDGGEAEDQYFFRDWAWVEDVIKRAFEAGRAAERLAGK
jgi:hypothetical protein